MRDVGGGEFAGIRPIALRPAAAAAGAAGAEIYAETANRGFAELRLDLHSIEERLASLRSKLELMARSDEASAQVSAQVSELAPHRHLHAAGSATPPRQGGQTQAPRAAGTIAAIHALEPMPAPGPAPAPAPAQAPAAIVGPMAAGTWMRDGSRALAAMRLLRGGQAERSNGYERRPNVSAQPSNGPVHPSTGYVQRSNGHLQPPTRQVDPGQPEWLAPEDPSPPPNLPPTFSWQELAASAGAGPAGTGPAGTGPAGAVEVQEAVATSDGTAQPELPTGRIPALAEVRPHADAEAGWLGTALRRIATGDRAAAGRAIVGLLPIQGDVIRDDVAYDLVISGGASYAVTVTEEEVAIQRVGIPRPLASIDGRIDATLENLGTLPTTKRLRSLLRSGTIRVSGRHGRRALAALHEVAAASVSLKRSYEAGVVLPEDVLLALVAGAIPPEWTIGHRFTICVETTGDNTEPRERLFLRVNDGGAVAVSRGLPLDIPTATIRCQPNQLPQILLGAAPAEATMAGDRAPVMLLQGWISRLESGRL